MNSNRTLEHLIEGGVLSADSEVLSTHNNLIVASKTEKIVARVGLLSEIRSKEDPGDIAYSHHIAWEAGRYSAALKPISEHPIVQGDMIISKYPLMKPVDWLTQNMEMVVEDVASFNEGLSAIREVVELRKLDVREYSQHRLDVAANTTHADVAHSVTLAQNLINEQEMLYPFEELTRADTGLVHGDLHFDNFVARNNGHTGIIDLDSTSYGPRLYDLAAWRFRREAGDKAPVEKAINISRNATGWNEEMFRALIGWKALSSMTHIIRYEQNELLFDRVRNMSKVAIRAGALLGRAT